jgi:hypothetical protein
MLTEESEATTEKHVIKRTGKSSLRGKFLPRSGEFEVTRGVSLVAGNNCKTVFAHGIAE